MLKRLSKAHAKFKSVREKIEIIGGETDFCAERYGFQCNNGGIEPSYYMQKYVPSALCYGTEYAQTLALCDGVAMYAGAESKFYVWRPRVSARPLALMSFKPGNYYFHHYVYDGKNVEIIIRDTKATIISNDLKMQTKTLGKSLSDAVFHCGRIFGIDSTDKYVIRWSGYSIDDWTEGIDGAGYLRLDTGFGKLLNLYVLNEKIIALRESGLNVISVLGYARHMRMNVEYKFGIPTPVEGNSIILRGHLWICTAKGLYVFDGSEVKKAPFDPIMRQYEYKLGKPQASDGRYIYYTTAKGSDAYLYKYDTETGGGTLFGKGCRVYFEESGNAYCFKGNNVYQILPGGNDLDCVWTSKPFTFEGRTRVLKSLNVEGGGDPQVEINCDGRIVNAAGTGKHCLCESGKSFTFTVAGNCSVSSMTAEWEVFE